MHRNAEVVQQALLAASSSARVIELDSSARTAGEAAQSLGVDLGQIVKSLVFAGDGIPLLILVAGDRRVDVAKAAKLVGARVVERAAPELVRRATGFPIGGVAPLGHPQPLRALVDESLARFDTVWAAAGTPHAVFPTTFSELVSLTAGRAGEVITDIPSPTSS
ncbi:MAG: YbaK/EbsC family protein [Acidimicrobiales bacterium]